VARKFITTRETALIDGWVRELMQDFVQQEVIYYAISTEESRVHDVYDEAVLKEYLQPVRINARVKFDQTATRAGGGTLDSTYSLLVELHSEECRQRNVIPREGDFIEFGQIVFEITSVKHAQPVFGQIDDKLKYELVCVSSREGQFKVDSSRIDGIDNTHPVEHPVVRTLGDDL
jgi:hypothetical protein